MVDIRRGKMIDLLILVTVAAVWGWLLQHIAERRGGSLLPASSPALVQQSYLSLWIIGVAVAALAIWIGS
jgi:hypothetical protein